VSVARRWRIDPAAIEHWHPDVWHAAVDLLATEEIHRRRAEARSKHRSGARR
jgi:hypothetical protein